MIVPPKIFCALDTADVEQAKRWAASVGPVTGALKVGMEYVNAHGPQGIEVICEACPTAALFIDLKFHDIPNTVAGAVRTMCEQFAPAYLNVHAAGGQAMMEAAKAACGAETKLLGVTILTSLNNYELHNVGYRGEVDENVERLAKLAQGSGLDGIVCSAHEIEAVRGACGAAFELMVPGIRPVGADAGDQVRVMTPKEALDNGATHLVIGRPITGSDDPAVAARAILDSLSDDSG